MLWVWLRLHYVHRVQFVNLQMLAEKDDCSVVSSLLRPGAVDMGCTIFFRPGCVVTWGYLFGLGLFLRQEAVGRWCFETMRYMRYTCEQVSILTLATTYCGVFLLAEIIEVVLVVWAVACSSYGCALW